MLENTWGNLCLHWLPVGFCICTDYQFFLVSWMGSRNVTFHGGKTGSLEYISSFTVCFQSSLQCSGEATDSPQNFPWNPEDGEFHLNWKIPMIPITFSLWTFPFKAGSVQISKVYQLQKTYYSHLSDVMSSEVFCSIMRKKKWLSKRKEPHAEKISACF